MTAMSDPFDAYPYAERFPVNRGLPERGRQRDELMEELRELAREEDAVWRRGRCSGTIYCGEGAHYDFLTQAFGLFAHQNALQRDMCPSATRFEGEIVAMTLDLMHADGCADATPAGMVTSGGTGSILHAVLRYREQGRQAGIAQPNLVKPETGHPAFNKACHLFGIELRTAPVDPTGTVVDPAAIDQLIDGNTVAIVGSACNYGYGTIDPIEQLSAIALEHGVGLHVDGCLGGFILPWGEQLGYEVPCFDFRLPGVTTISADTHKYGYALKGTSVLLFRDRALRNLSYFYLPEWSGGKYFSPGMEGSRSVGLLASTWAAMVSLGREGYLRHAAEILDVAMRLQETVRSHPELRLLGKPTFAFAFTADEFDIYHVNDYMRKRGWRFNGLQYPNALHIAVTRPQTQPGVVEAFAADLGGAVEHAIQHAHEPAESAAIYGGVPGGFTDQAGELVSSVMETILDAQQGVP
jgi:sphinganine-1-phosphate aldolase